jgi:4-hydroxybenzoate polyprenyltransferase
MVDREDDLRIGVRSTAILFGDLDRAIIGAMQLMMLLGLGLVGRSLGFGLPWRCGLLAAGVLFLRQQWLIRHREPAACFRAFLDNHYAGMAIFAGLALEYALRNS